MTKYFTDNSTQSVCEELETRLQKDGLSWEDLAESYNEIAPVENRHSIYELKALIESGEVTLKELTIVFLVLKLKPWFYFSPVHQSEIELAENWDLL